MKLYEPAPPARKDELANVQDGIAVIVDGDTCPVVVESGMYAYIKNNTHGLAEGLYKNISNSAFPTSGGTADGTVFDADSTGGLNALKASLIKFDTVSGTTDRGGVLATNISPSNRIILIGYPTNHGWCGVPFLNNDNDAWFFSIIGNPDATSPELVRLTAVTLIYAYIDGSII